MYDNTQQYSLMVCVKGKPITEYTHTDGNTYVEGRQGSEYTIVITNRSSERILAVPSVDGLSVMDGKSAGIHSSGYVINSFSSETIPGWRLNSNNIAKFTFGDLKDSYANSNSGTTNVGVIGCLVFREMVRYRTYVSYEQPTPTPIWTNDSLPNKPWTIPSPTLDPNSTGYDPNFGRATVISSNSEAMLRRLNDIQLTASSASYGSGEIRNLSNDLGTEFGRQTTFNTTSVTFDKRNANAPDALLAIYYDSKRGLEKRGVILRKHFSSPNPFPTYNSGIGCSPPKNWRG